MTTWSWSLVRTLSNLIVLVAVFWGIRLALQAVFDINPYLPRLDEGGLRRARPAVRFVHGDLSWAAIRAGHAL